MGIIRDDITLEGNLSITGTLSHTGNQSVTGAVTATTTVQGADLVATDDLTVGDDATIGGDLAVVGTFAPAGPVDMSGADSITLPTGHHLIRKWTSGNVLQTALSAGTSNSIDLPAGDDGAFPAGVQVVGAYLEVTTAITLTGTDTTSVTLGLGVSGSPVSYLAAGANLAGAGTGIKENATGTLVGSYRAADTPQLYVSGGGDDPDMADIDTLGARAIIYYFVP